MRWLVSLTATAFCFWKAIGYNDCLISAFALTEPCGSGFYVVALPNNCEFVENGFGEIDEIWHYDIIEDFVQKETLQCSRRSLRTMLDRLPIGRSLNLQTPINWQSPLNRGLVSRWDVLPFGPHYGGPRFLDLTGANHGTLTNGPTWQGALGRSGGYGSLNFVAASSQYVELGSFGIGAADFGFGLWFKTTTAALQVWIGQNTGPDWWLGIGLAAAGKITASISGTTIDSSATWNDGNWHHAFTTRLGTTQYLYVDGLSAAGPITNTNTGIAATVSLGRFDDGGFYSDADFGGLTFSNLRGYSASEVYALYEDSLRGSPETLNWISTRTYFGVSAAPPAGAFTKLQGRGGLAGVGGITVGPGGLAA